MHTILGASGPIGQELAASIHRDFGSKIRLVARNPKKVNEADELLRADLLDAAQTRRAVEGSSVAYLTVGLPMDTKLWEAQWPTLMRNTIDACAASGTKLVFFDNTYMYPQTSAPQTEEAPFAPSGPKGQVRARIARDLLVAMGRGRLDAMIARAPEFYGPGKTQSITNNTTLEPLLRGKKARVFVRDDTRRSLIFAPDASRAMALLGHTDHAFGQTWHLPCDDDRLTYRELVALAADVFGVKPRHRVVPRWQLTLAGLFHPVARDAAELLPRYGADNVFVSDKFKAKFPDFGVTSFREGLSSMRADGGQKTTGPMIRGSSSRSGAAGAALG